MGNVDVDYATGSFCSSSSILLPTAGGLWWFKMRSGERLSGAGEIPRAQYHSQAHKQKAEQLLVAQQGRLGAAAGPSPERPSCIRGVPGVRNAGVAGGVIHPVRHCSGSPGPLVW